MSSCQVPIDYVSPLFNCTALLLKHAHSVTYQSCIVWNTGIVDTVSYHTVNLTRSQYLWSTFSTEAVLNVQHFLKVFVLTNVFIDVNCHLAYLVDGL